jgi:hypothetical protein
MKSRLRDNENPYGTVASNYNFDFPLTCSEMCHLWPSHWTVKHPVTSHSLHFRQLYVTFSAIPLRVEHLSHFSRVITQHLNSSSLTDGSEAVRVPCVKAVLFARKVNTREKLLQRIISAARCINTAAGLPYGYTLAGHAGRNTYSAAHVQCSTVCTWTCNKRSQ